MLTLDFFDLLKNEDENESVATIVVVRIRRGLFDGGDDKAPCHGCHNGGALENVPAQLDRTA